MAPKKDCVTLFPRKNLPIASRDQYTSDSGIGSPWEPGRSLWPLNVSPGCTLSRYENSNWTNNGSCDQLCALRPCFYLVWDEGDNIILSVGDLVGLFPHNRLVRLLSYMGFWCFDAIHFAHLYRSLSVQSPRCQLSHRMTVAGSL